MTAALTVRDLSIGYAVSKNVVVPVVSGVDFSLQRGSILGLAGESGCGKSTASLAAIGYRSPTARVISGQSVLGDEDLLCLSREQLRSLWGMKVAYVAQNATTALNPALRIGEQIAQPLRRHLGLSGDALRERQAELLESVRIAHPVAALRRYPHQFSGGQQQRIAIAIAISCRPDVLVLDEPTTGLDVTTQARITRLLRELVETQGMAGLYVSHDLALLSKVTDSLAVMYAGEIVERGATRDVLTHPEHPYTRALMASVPSLRERRAVATIPGRPPPEVVLDQCSFAVRCPMVADICREQHPVLAEVGADHVARCLRVRDERPSTSSLRLLGAPTKGDVLLSLRGVSATYAGSRSPVIADIDLDVAAGETVGIVGESGSGKSTLLRCIAGLHVPAGGTIDFRGTALQGRADRRPRETRRQIQLVFQNPETSLNPRHTVAQIVGRPLRLFRPDIGRRQVEAAVAKLLDEVQLPSAFLHRYPSELSGGQKQRISLARAFAAEPSLLLCDEVTSALDVSVQATILRLIDDLAREHGTAVIFVSHDLAVVRTITQRALVMKDGQVVESGLTETLFTEPEHDYTRELIGAIPDIAG
jgi:peptide/nickel transport system ATP-binding protein